MPAHYRNKINNYAVDIRPAAGRNFSVIFVRHFPFVHVRCIVSALFCVMIMAQPRCFQVGDAFSSYEELKKHIEEFKRANFIRL